jgi:hypothetical protein
MMNKGIIFFVVIISILFFLSITCTKELVKNSVWDGTSHDSSDDTIQLKFTNVVFGSDGAMTFTLRPDTANVNENFTGTYSIDLNEKLNFSGALTEYPGMPKNEYTNIGCIGYGTISYSNNIGSGTLKIGTNKLIWKIHKIRDF